MPVISKVIETILRDHLRDAVGPTQNPLQRGFTAKVSPMNCALILQESLLFAKCTNKPVYIAFLNAKSAFDVVNHDSLMRKMYLRGVTGQLWNLLHDMNISASTVVTWNGKITSPFQVKQGVRQGGVLSTECYKVYVDTLLDLLQKNHLGKHIGQTCVAAPTCADDIALVADTPYDLQLMINIAVDYSKTERYSLQPTKSIILEVLPNHLRDGKSIRSWQLDGEPMPNVQRATHLGICRSVTEPTNTIIQDNISKSRRAAYSLLGPGLHGTNGVDPTTACKLLQTFIVPIIVYGLEVILPTKNELQPLERFFKKLLKQNFTLPTTTADAAVYIISGFMTVEAEVHKRALSLYGNICRTKDTIEKRLMERQLSLPTSYRYSWFSKVKRLLAIYDLGSSHDLHNNMPSRDQWKLITKRKIKQYWKHRICTIAELSPTLKYLCCNKYHPGTPHQIVTSIHPNCRDVERAYVKLKLATGNYVLQTNRAAFNQTPVDPTCLLCRAEPETIEHFLLHCPTLKDARVSLLQELNHILHQYDPYTAHNICDADLVALIIDSCSLVCCRRSPAVNYTVVNSIEFTSRRLCFQLHVARATALKAILPK